MANIVERIAQQVTSVGAKASYGDPVTVGGVELVPVALVWFGFGGGSDEAGFGSVGADRAGGELGDRRGCRGRRSAQKVAGFRYGRGRPTQPAG